MEIEKDITQHSVNAVSSDDPHPRPGPPKQLVIPPPHENVLRYANRRKKKIQRNAWWRVLLRVAFSQLGIFLILCGYVCLGAWFLIRIEKDNEDSNRLRKDKRFLDVNDTINYLANLFWFLKDQQNITNSEWNNRIFEEMKCFERFIIDSVGEVHYDGQLGTWTEVWTFGNSIFFVVTTLTTIGYGNVVPETVLGRLYVVVYSLLGIPLLLFFLANIGNGLAKMFRYSYSRFCCHWCRVRRKKSQYQKGDETLLVPKQALRVWNDDIGNEEWLPTTEVNVPILLTCLLLVAYTIIGAILFSYSEGWDLISSVYFTVITLTTIGFGDMLPENVLEDDTKNHRDLLMISIAIYCGLGIALLSMCIALLQSQVVDHIRRFGVQLGIIKKPRINKDQI